MSSIDHTITSDAADPGRAAVHEDITRAIAEMVAQDWDVVPDAPVGPETRLVADLEFASIDLVALLSDIEELYGRRDFPFEELLMVDGRYVDDLNVSQIAEFLFEHGARK